MVHGDRLTEQYTTSFDDRTFRDSSRPTLPHREVPWRDPGTSPRLLVATRDRGSLLQLTMLLVGRATVHPVHDERELVALAARGGPGAVLVLDGCAPSLRLLDAAIALEASMPGLPVIVWGGDPDARLPDEIAASLTQRWHRLPSDTDIAALARLAETLL